MRFIVGVRSIGEPTRGSGRHTPTVWFESSRQLAGVLSDENRALLRLMHERHPRTVLELAELSGRAASNLSRTLKTLESFGIVKMNRTTNSRAVRPEALATKFLVVLD